VVLEEQTLEIEAPGNRTSVTSHWVAGGDEAAGLNRLHFFIDPEAVSEEWPLPVARTNNELEIDGEPGFPFFVFNNGVELAWPYDYAMLPTDSLTLVAYSSNPLADEADYLFQIDTLPTFTSPFQKSTRVSKSGGRISWKLPFPLEAGRVYYWRTALIGTEGVDTVWKSASFVHVPEREGWNQSHLGQWLQSDSIFLNAGRYRLELPKEALNITIQNRVKGGTVAPNFVANGINVGSVNRAWNLVDEGIGICVIDTLIFTLQPNPPGGLYGSVNDNQVTRAFVFRTDSPESRADAVRFLDSIVPVNSHVFIFTIFDEEQNGASLQLDEWAADTSIYGGSLIEALQRRGATSLQNLMMEERQVYNFFYRQSASGFTRLQEDFLFSTEEVLVNSETMGRRLPRGYFQSPNVDLYQDSVTASVAFRKENPGDSVQVTVFSSTGDDLFEISSPETLPLQFSDSVSQFNFFVQLMNFETRRAPSFEHLRVYQDHVPDYFWSPPAVNQRPDSVFVKGTPFEWYSDIAGVGNDEGPTALRVSYRIQNQGNVVYRDTGRVEIHSEDSEVRLFLETSDWPTGTYTLTAQINPDREPIEKRYSNNILSTSFTLIQEQVEPILEVTLDGELVAQDEWVRRRPRLNMSVQKVDGVVPITAEQLEYELVQPDGSFYSFSGDVVFSSRDSLDVLWGEWQADLDLEQEGRYNLRVVYEPSPGSAAKEIIYQLRFQRRNTAEVREITLTPNPTTGRLFAHYDIVGERGPAGWTIDLISSDGRLLWQSESYMDLPIGQQRLDLGEIPMGVSSGYYVFRFRLLTERALPYGGEKGQIKGHILLLRP
jgi:hypothetical protein